jgi:CRISPR/Cas system CSM-associated protein Csm2 small subunit
LPANYLKNGYFDDKGNILAEVIIDWPRDIATKLADARPEMKAAQLRNFFNEARHIESQLSAGKDFASLRGRILQLDSYAASAQTRRNAPPLFKEFIEQNVKWAARDEKSFLKGFIPHFECVVAYFPKKD